MMEYIADISRERVRFRGGGYAPSQPVESPHGSKDAFYIKIDKHYGSSDHVTYMQHGIPAVMFITWPDMWYHSSEDTPDKQDPTQYKRAAAVGPRRPGGHRHRHRRDGSARRWPTTSAAASRAWASRTPRASATWPTPPAARRCTNAYKEARIAILHQAAIEKAVVRSASVLWTNVDDGRKKTAAFEPLIDQRAGALLNEVKAAYQLQAAAARRAARSSR